MVKLKMSAGVCPNGVWIFNNTSNSNVTGLNFYAVDIIASPNVTNIHLLNNVFVTEMNAYSTEPVITNGEFNYNVSLKPFGYAETYGFQADPLLTPDGLLSENSPAKGMSALISINNYFASPRVVPAWSNAGAFQTFPAPMYVVPPDGEPDSFPGNVPGWPDAPIPPS
jgi:hypothetical protein